MPVEQARRERKNSSCHRLVFVFFFFKRNHLLYSSQIAGLFVFSLSFRPPWPTRFRWKSKRETAQKAKSSGEGKPCWIYSSDTVWWPLTAGGHIIHYDVEKPRQGKRNSPRPIFAYLGRISSNPFSSPSPVAPHRHFPPVVPHVIPLLPRSSDLANELC